MKPSKVVIPTNQEELKPNDLVLTPEEKRQLIDFFSILMEVDRRLNFKKGEEYEKANNI
ncbi:hypothetical protein J7J95_00040 [bacterium]|nr:hypothetical protein [bacterium]